MRVPADPDFDDLQTERLRIRRFRMEDAPVFAAYRSDPGVARYQSWDTFSLQEAERFVHEMASTHPGIPGEWFQFAVGAPSTDALVGDVALCVAADDTSRAEMGFTFAPANQGRGYATEAVRGVIAYAFDRLAVTTVVAIVDARNAPSIALLERIGMRLTTTEHVRFKGEWCDEHTFELRKGEA